MQEWFLSGCNLLLDKETEVGSSDQESSLSAGKITFLFLMQCYNSSTANSIFAGIFEIPECHLLR